jgi:hypothetical protein
VNTQALQRLNLEAWGYLLRQDRELGEVRVSAVAAEPLTAQTTRYWLTLEGHPEPITLLGQETSTAEYYVQEAYAHRLSQLLPRCWHSELVGETGWMVVDDVPHDHAPRTWTMRDAEKLVEQLAILHSTFWGEEPALAQLPTYIGRTAAAAPDPNSQASKVRAIYRRQIRSRGGRALPASYLNFDLRQVGTQAPALMRATVGLQILRGMGGWPGVLTEKHLDAFDNLLERPDLMLQPLREVPFTLLHGRPAVEKWRVSLFDAYTLVGWQQATLGPSVCDLIYFVEDFFVNCTSINPLEKRPYYFYQEWPVVEETLIDTYFIKLGELLGTDEYSARALRRRALPAARCLYVLTTWLPLISDWFAQLPNSRHTWEMLESMNEAELAATGHTPLIALRPHLRPLFDRFLEAYTLLWM